MAKKQSRRSVSIRGVTYEQIRKYCERNNVSMSEFVEERIAMFFGNGGSKDDDDKPSEKIAVDDLQDAARFFTF
jgi:hypothetical protein